MGNKAGYAEVILAAMGLRSGEGAGAYLWAEADPDVRALLRAYPDAAMLRRIADIIRGWADEEPRALWERLRAERKARGPMAEPDVAGWIITTANSWKGEGEHYKEPADLSWSACLTTDEASARCSSLAAYATIVSGNRLVNMGGADLMNTGNGGTRFGGADFATPAADVAEAFERVAEWSFLHQGSFQYKGPDAGIGRPEGMEERGDHGAIRPVTAILGDAFPRLAHGAWPPVAVLPTIPRAADVAAWLGTPGDLEGCVVYADPPYVGTTGYGADLSRDEVIAYARDFDALGAVVCISEAEPIAALGWEATEITGGRKGQKRTFSKQQREWLTMNRSPAMTVAVQVSMFARAE